MRKAALAEDLEHARTAIETFAGDYGTRWPKAVAKVTDDAEALLTFFNCPAEHWLYLRTTHPIERAFAPVGAGARFDKASWCNELRLTRRLPHDCPGGPSQPTPPAGHPCCAGGVHQRQQRAGRRHPARLLRPRHPDATSDLDLLVCVRDGHFAAAWQQRTALQVTGAMV